MFVYIDFDPDPPLLFTEHINGKESSLILDHTDWKLQEFLPNKKSCEVCMIFLKQCSEDSHYIMIAVKYNENISQSPFLISILVIQKVFICER